MSKKRARTVELSPPEQPNYGSKFHYELKNQWQKELWDIINSPKNQIIVIAGEAGTGKTFLAIASAINQLLNKRIRRIHITRPCIYTGGDEHGFIPGTLQDKLHPWLLPILDNVRRTTTAEGKDFKLVTESLVFEPLGMLRGRTMEDCFFICDEASNCTWHQMMTVATRTGHRCKTIFTGDDAQTDIKNSGFMDFYRRMSGVEGVACYTIPPEGQVRSAIVQRIIDAAAQTHSPAGLSRILEH